MRPIRQGGALYLVVLFLVAAVGAGLAALGRSWAHEAQREREALLLDAGSAYRRAIARYYEATPGPVKTYPSELAALLRDPRFPDNRRYLRQPLPDPITGKMDWILIAAPGGGIAGVASRADGVPLKRTGFAGANRVFEALSAPGGDPPRYRDWAFVYSPGQALD